MSSSVERRSGDIRANGKIARRALAQAINRTARGFRASTAKAVAQDMGLKVRDVRAASSVTKARARTVEKGAVYEAKGRRLNLIRFGARQTRRGVSAKAWGKRRIYRGTFVANQGRTVFVRVGKSRLPIRPVWGPGIAEQARKHERKPEVRAELGARVGREFASSFDYLLARSKKPKV